MPLIIKHESGAHGAAPDEFRFADITDSTADAQHVPPRDAESHLESNFTTLPLDTLPGDAEAAVADPKGHETQLAALQQVFSTTVTEILRVQKLQQATSEQHVLQLAVAISERIIRGQLDRQPDISLWWIRESLELLSRSHQLRIYLNPQDQQCLGDEAEKLAAQIARVASVEIIADAGVSPGGCRVESDQGLVDQTVESQLQRILEELGHSLSG